MLRPGVTGGLLELLGVRLAALHRQDTVLQDGWALDTPRMATCVVALSCSSRVLRLVLEAPAFNGASRVAVAVADSAVLWGGPSGLLALRVLSPAHFQFNAHAVRGLRA